MKPQTLLLAFFGSALAAIHTEYNLDGSTKSVHYSADDVDSVLDKRTGKCSPNNCLRAMKGRPEAATSFCRTFTKAVQTDVSPFTQCNGASRASDACTCFVAKPTRRPCTTPTSSTTVPTTTSSSSAISSTTSSTAETGTSTTTTEATTSSESATPSPQPTCGPAGSACTIDNFVLACCGAPDGSVGCYFPTGDPYDGICFV